MGDRALVKIVDPFDSPVYLYTHWSGYKVPSILKSALTRGRSRWGDAPYLARIIFCEMVKGDLEGETGYGISAYPIDGAEYTVNCSNRSITFPDQRIQPFEEFIK